MNKFRLFFFLILALSIAAPGRCDTLESKLIDLIQDPSDFFFNIHANNEDFSPVPTDRNGTIRSNFLPTTLPLTWANITVKAKVLKDAGNIPQVDLVGMYGDLLALRAAESALDDVKPTFNDYSFGATISKNANENTRIFGGVRFSTIKMSVQLSSSSAVSFAGRSYNTFNIDMAETFFFTGITYKASENKYIIAQAAYGFKFKKIMSRIMVAKRRFEYGFDIFPEGFLVIQPFIGWHWYF